MKKKFLDSIYAISTNRKIAPCWMPKNQNVEDMQRLSYLLFVGEIGDTDILKAICDREECCSPHHLSKNDEEPIKYEAVIKRKQIKRAKYKPRINSQNNNYRN